MQVILQKRMKNLGNVGDLVEAKAGFFRNYLLPQGAAVLATPENKEALESRRAELEAQEAKALSEAQTKHSKIDGKSVSYAARSGEGGKLYGSVGSAELANAIGAELGVEVQKSEIYLPAGPLRMLGEYDIEIGLHPDITAQVHFNVVAA